MKDLMKFKGHFAIQTIDADNQVIDQWEDNNMIMEVARTTMSKILSQINGGITINKLILGTNGHVGSSITIPKTSNEGFVSDRDRLFSEELEIDDNESVPLHLNDIVKYVGSASATGITNHFYRYVAPAATISTNTTNFEDTAIWENLDEDEPYTYEIEFTLPETNDANATNIIEDDISSGSTVHILQEGTSVTFTTNIVPAAANSGGGAGAGTSVFTEAALYSGDDIFAMKVFKAKIKDSTVLLRIIWTITF